MHLRTADSSYVAGRDAPSSACLWTFETGTNLRNRCLLRQQVRYVVALPWQASATRTHPLPPPLSCLRVPDFGTHNERASSQMVCARLCLVCTLCVPFLCCSVSKSANYCHPQLDDQKRTRGLLMLCEVALGECKEYTNAVTDLTQAADGFHSTHGVGQMSPNKKTWKMHDGQPRSLSCSMQPRRLLCHAYLHTPCSFFCMTRHR